MSKELLISIYSEYKKYYDRIYDLKTGEYQQLGEDLINFCTERKWETSAVLMIISIASESNLLHLREYWELFKMIYNHFQIRPSSYLLKPHIAVLYSKEYQKTINIEYLPEQLKNYKEMDIDAILNIYEPSSKMHCILHDNVENFAIEMGPVIDKETFNQKFEDGTLLEWCSYFGSLLCFRYLRGQGVEITENCLAYSFIGKNKEIIRECLAEFGEMLKQINIMKICLRINDEDYLMALHDDYHQSWSFDDVTEFLNLKAFLILASLTNQTDLVFSYIGAFGITEIFKYMRFKDFDVVKALKYAAIFNNVDSISKLVELGANIEAKVDDGCTALIVAALFNSVDSISKLVELGANIEAKNNDGYSALIYAASSNSVDSISKLVEFGADIEAKNNDGETALIRAAFNNSVDSISKLVELGADVEAKDNNGYTALIVAAVNNSVDSISKLVEFGADIEAKNNDGETALIRATHKNQVDSISKLVELGANIEAKVDDEYTALMYAAVDNSVDSISKLVELGADIEAKNNNGATALIVAALFNSADSISKLVELGADIEAKDNLGNTALMYAAYKNSVDSISKLVELGADIEAKNNNGETALIKADDANNIDSILKLLELGANPHGFNQDS